MNSRLWAAALVLLSASACGPPQGDPDLVLKPLTARPEDPDTIHIRDQNDFMASASPNGDRILFTSSRTGREHLWVMRVDGSDQRQVTTGPGTQMQGSWSPDGDRIVYLDMVDGVRSIAVVNADGSGRRILADAPRNWPIPMWSPDGERILYHAPGPFGGDDLWTIRPDGGEPVVLVGSAASDRHGAWSPDGSQVVLSSRRDGGDFEIYVVDLESGAWTRLTDDDADDYTPSWSPDGSRVVFQSPTRTGRWTIFTAKVDGSGPVAVTEYPMQWDPVWSHDGKEIFFNSGRDGRRGIYVMNAEGANPRKLSNTNPGPFVGLVRTFDVDVAAQRFREAHAADPAAVFFYEREVQYLGEKYLEMGDLRRATVLFEVNSEAYPGSSSAWADLGHVRLAAGQIRSALGSYERALELDPDNESLEALVERLQSEPTAPSLDGSDG